jgi:hypothetical protein
MANMTETELRRRLKKLESEPTASTALVSKVGDQYEYDKDFIYIAYASALVNLSSGSITNQSDATDFQFTPYTKTGTLMPFRGYFINKSIYQSGDPTDYTWESTSGSAGYTSTERAYTTSTGLQNTLGNPTKPGSGVGWTTLTSGTAIPATATYYARRFTLTTTDGAVTSSWDIEPVGKHIDQTVVSASGIKANNMDLDGQLNVTANNGSILWGKTGSTDTVNTGLFLGRDSSGNPRIVFGNASSFINFDGTDVSLVNCDVDNNAGTNAVIITNTSSTTTYTIGPNIATINIQLSGGGGGGGGGQGDFSSAGTAGGASSVVVYTAAGSARTGTGALSISASGGSGGTRGGVGGNTGGTGASFTHGSATEPPFTDAAGGAGSTHVAEPANRPVASNGAIPSAGGGGDGRAGSQDSGGGGGVGSYNSTTYTVVDTTDYLVVTVGAGGIGDNSYVNNPGDDGGGGDGGRGVVRLQGAT